MATPLQITWVRDALEHIYDLASLSRYCAKPPSAQVCTNALELQRALLVAISQLKPTAEVPANSLVWRVYNALDHRYIRGLTQVETSVELNISLRQLRREQDRGIEAVATLLFSPDTQPAFVSNAAADGRPDDRMSGFHNEYIRLDELLHAVLSLLDPLFSQRNVDVRVALPAPTPIVWNNRISVRQLLIMAITWSLRELTSRTVDIIGRIEGNRVELDLCSVGPKGGLNIKLSDDELRQFNDLATSVGIKILLATQSGRCSTIHLSIPISDRLRVLMIDDNPDSIELTRRYLARSQFDLVAVTHAEEGLSQVISMQPSCILLDVMMPGRDGWEILALLKSHSQTIHIPVIVCSILQNNDLAIALGAAAILSRPHTPEQLLETMLRAISSSPQRLAKQSV